MSEPTASCLPSTKAKEAMRYVIGMVLDFNPVNDCPLWLALINDATDKNLSQSLQPMAMVDSR
jgi:hypothetical protein